MPAANDEDVVGGGTHSGKIRRLGAGRGARGAGRGACEASLSCHCERAQRACEATLQPDRDLPPRILVESRMRPRRRERSSAPRCRAPERAGRRLLAPLCAGYAGLVRMARRHQAATAREKQIKAGSRGRKIRPIEQMNPEWRNLSGEL
jgi:hypothetical protein